MVMIILMSLWYTGCGLNIALIATTMLLVLIMPLISLKTEVIKYIKSDNQELVYWI
jgi:hypothetical protein